MRSCSSAGMPGPIPCTPAGIEALLAHYDVAVAGRNVCILGRGVTIGRPLAITRHYFTWNISLTGKTIQRTVVAGHIPYIAWHATTKGNVALPWASITSGSQDAWIVAQADALRNAGFPVYLTFHHEPEDDLANGTPACGNTNSKSSCTCFGTCRNPNSRPSNSMRLAWKRSRNTSGEPVVGLLSFSPAMAP